MHIKTSISKTRKNTNTNHTNLAIFSSLVSRPEAAVAALAEALALLAAATGVAATDAAAGGGAAAASDEDAAGTAALVMAAICDRGLSNFCMATSHCAYITKMQHHYNSICNHLTNNSLLVFVLQKEWQALVSFPAK